MQFKTSYQIPASLCIKCRAAKNLCGLSYCPILVQTMTMLKNQTVKYPRAMIPAFGEGICILTTGISRSLRKAALIAVEEMIDDITRTTGLSEEEAYALCSVAGNLKISEIVDEPNYVVSLTLPKNLLYH